MKLLYVHQHFVTPKGAGAIRSYAMAQSMIQRGHQVTMVCGSIGGGTTGLTGPFIKGMRRGFVDGIDVVELDLEYSNSDNFLKRSVTFSRFAFRGAALALREKYDVIFATTTPLTAGVPGILARWLRGKPFVFEVRDLWPELPKAMGVITNPLILGAMTVLEWTSYRSAHRLIGLSPGIVDGIARRGVERERIALVPNGCDLDIFTDKVVPWRPEGVNKDDLMAVYTGTHGAANGLDAVLDAAAVLKQKHRNDIKLVLVGQGKSKPALTERARREQLDNVIFHDPVKKMELAGLMASANVGMQILANVEAFYFGTSPNKFFDYIAAGIPVLNNYPGWLAGLIEQNQCGFAIMPNDPDAFAESLMTAADHREELKRMGERARELAESQFDRSLLSAKWTAVVEQSTLNGMGNSESSLRKIVENSPRDDSH